MSSTYLTRIPQGLLFASGGFNCRQEVCDDIIIANSFSVTTNENDLAILRLNLPLGVRNDLKRNIGPKMNKERKYTMTMEDLAPALADYGVTVRKAQYFP
uniref:Uncharacterized protein n=1 Tax=Glossina palpalis gambiensis TaxID=67801 RepID=A0A1B0BTQ1_9MUSC